MDTKQIYKKNMGDVPKDTGFNASSFACFHLKREIEITSSLVLAAEQIFASRGLSVDWRGGRGKSLVRKSQGLPNDSIELISAPQNSTRPHEDSNFSFIAIERTIAIESVIPGTSGQLFESLLRFVEGQVLEPCLGYASDFPVRRGAIYYCLGLERVFDACESHIDKVGHWEYNYVRAPVPFFLRDVYHVNLFMKSQIYADGVKLESWIHANKCGELRDSENHDVWIWSVPFSELDVVRKRLHALRILGATEMLFESPKPAWLSKFVKQKTKKLGDTK
jgi:hypothetical protein